MTLLEYQQAAQALDRGTDDNLWYPCLGMTGELGEVTEPIKKWYRDGRPIDREYIKLELGDVLWYLTTLTRRLGLSLEEVAHANINKLQLRRLQDAKMTVESVSST